ncbi:sigma-54-dependent transcriptional regulator [Orientia tsutsugamushi]|uniref:Putative response regulator NtrX-like n=2 Tax=Orientia tsutsugamushi TaxID=784 RepID=A0A2U3R493_ORITS|nr:sigma-54 dependent transcriptional regulator [Orientia tsutsugamushi]KJV54890.1 AAA domain family protein [Orientia tsutsugamushi str. Kato PP]SPR08017.1 sigma-54-dependent Fis family transcriptional regulator [Orientia tsutsugamushi]
MGHVLIIDDEHDVRALLSDIVKSKGFTPTTAENSSEALSILDVKLPKIVILDVWLRGSDLDGLGILEIIRKKHPLVPVIIISGHATIETAVTAIKMGAYDYVEKPFTADKIVTVLKRACETARLKKENIDLRTKVIDRSEIIGQSPAINKLKAEIEKISPTSGRVMITGNIGCGKELVAQLIHRRSKYALGPFVTFCPTALTEEQAKYELFGERNINNNSDFTYKVCALEAANNGTLYIDEIADLPLSLQSRLLKFLQDNNFEKNGSSTSVKLNIRLISATAKNIQEEVTLGRFRQDLYYRLNVIPIHVPSLAKRKEDIPLLVQHFVQQLAKSSGLKARKFSNEAIAALQAYDWLGNIRQLRNAIEWTLIMNPLTSNSNHEIEVDMLPPDIINNKAVSIIKSKAKVNMMSMPLRKAREVFEREYLVAQMNRFNNNISKTSAFVGMERSALHRKLKLLNINCSNKDAHNNDDYQSDDNLLATGQQNKECLA